MNEKRNDVEGNHYANRWDDVEEDAVVEMSIVQKVIGIFVSPTRTFKSLKGGLDYLLPLILVPLSMVLYYVIFWEEYAAILIRAMEVQYETMGLDITPGMIEASMSMQRVVQPIFAVAGVFFGFAVGALFIFICGKFAKSDMTFGGSFLLTAYAGLIGLANWVFIMIMTVALGEYDWMKPFTSLASFLPESMSTSIVYYALSPFEVFTIWSTVVTYIGLIHFGKFSKKAAAITVAIQFAFAILLVVGVGLIQQIGFGM